MRDHDTTKVGGASASEALAEAPAAVGKATLAERHGGEPHGEHLAQIGEQVLDALGSVLEAYADDLTKYTEDGADAAKEALAHLAATCGPGSVHVQDQVRLQANRLTGFYFARLVRGVGLQALHLAAACGELRKGLHEHRADAINAFIHKALLAGLEIFNEFAEFAKDIHEVNTLVAEIGTRCGERVAIPIPQDLMQFVVPQRRYRLDLDKYFSHDAPPIQIPGLTLPGGHVVLPKGLAIPHGPVIGIYVA